MSSTDRPRALTVLHVYGYGAPMILALVAVAWTAPLVHPLSTVPVTVVVAAGWGSSALGIALVSWWFAHRYGAGIQEFVALTPRWAHAHEPARETRLDAALVGAGAMAVYLLAHSVTAITSPTSPRPEPVELGTAITTAVLSDMVLLGVVGCWSGPPRQASTS